MSGEEQTRPPEPVAAEAATIEAALSAEEQAVLARLLAGTATAGEGLGLYHAVAGHGFVFPPDWEAAALRAALREDPGRADLLARLAELAEQARAPGDPPDLAARLGFERAWLRFARTDFTTPPPGVDLAAHRQAALDDLCSVLASPLFRAQTSARRTEILRAAHNSLLSAPPASLPAVVELGMLRFAEMLAAPELTEAEACQVYDALHSLYFAGIGDVRQLCRFDTVVPAFERWLEAQHGRHARPAVDPAAQTPLTVVYLLHTAHAHRGNAVSPLIAALAAAHGAHPGRRVLLYAVQHGDPGFLDDLEARGVAVRRFLQDDRYDRIAEIAAALQADGADVVITEQNRALAAALFVRRVAPLQLWLDTGFPFWSLSALDWTLSPVAARDTPGAARTGPVRLRHALAYAARAEVDPGAIAAIRAAFPQDAFVLGVFVRLSKITPPYLAFLARLLAADPRFHLILGGPGDAAAVEAFVARPELAGRAVFVPGNVDLKLYGQAIDLMVDTFPFIGGLACREVAGQGTPVLTRLGTPWDAFLRTDRNPDLLAETEAESLALARRLADDAAFRARQRDVALAKAAEYADLTQSVADVEDAIRAAAAPDPGGSHALSPE